MAVMDLRVSLQGDARNVLMQMFELLAFLREGAESDNVVATINVAAINGDFSFQFESTAADSQQAQPADRTLLGTEDPIGQLGLSPQLTRTLWGVEIGTIGALLRYTKDDLLALPELGDGRLNEIICRLAEHGWRLQDAAGS